MGVAGPLLDDLGLEDPSSFFRLVIAENIIDRSLPGSRRRSDDFKTVAEQS